MIVFPNAKINLGLDILSRRPDGYHEISTVMAPVGWHDVLEVVPSRGGKTTLTVSGNTVDCPPEKNLVMKAYRAMAELVEGLPAVDIYLRKIIPDGAGLGGGSADAAFTIRALNTLFSLDFPDEKLAEVAASIGADCPFFIYNKPMMATGIGTDLAPAVLPSDIYRMKLAIVKPPVGVSTARAYAGVSPARPAVELADAISRPFSEWNGTVKNDFEKSVFAAAPEIEAVKRGLAEMGAVYVSMSGSGSAVYAFFASDILAETLRERFQHCSVCLTSIIQGK